MPAFLVISADGPVRFSGTGFMALAAGSQTPYGLKPFSGETEAFVPLHLGRIIRNGSLGIVPARAGPLIIRWRTFAINPASGKPLPLSSGDGIAKVEVATGSPTLTIRDPYFFGGAAKRSIISPDTKQRLEDYGDHFQILAADTLEPEFESAGFNPRFSPTGRFIYFYKARATESADATDLTIYDLESSSVVLEHERGDGVGQSAIISIQWGLADSIVSLGTSKGGTLETYATLIDDRDPFIAGLGANCCTAVQAGAVAHIDIDNLLISYSPSTDEPGADEPIPLVFGPEDAGAILSPDDSRLRDQLAEQDDDDPDNNHKAADGRDQDVLQEAIERKVSSYFNGRLKPLDRTGRSIALRASYRLGEGGLPATATSLRSNRPGPVRGVRSLDQLQSRVFLQLPDARQDGFGDDLFAQRLEDLGIHIVKPATKIYHEAPIKQDDKHRGEWLSRDISRMMPGARPFIDPNDVCNPQTEDWTKPDSLKIAPYSAENVTFLTGSNIRLLLVTEGCTASPSISDFSLRLALLLQIDNQVPKLFWLSGLKAGDDKVDTLMAFDTAPFPAPRLEAELFDDRYLVIANGDDADILQYDLTTKTADVFDADVDAFGPAARLYRTDRGTLIRLDRDGGVHFYSPEDEATFLNGRYVDDELVIHDQSGFYDGTDEGARYVYLSFPGLTRPVSLAQYRSQLKRPDLIAETVRRGKDSDTALNLLPPPELELVLSSGSKDGSVATVADVSATASRTLKAIDLYVDGRPAASLPVTGVSVSIHVPVHPGGPSRWVTAVATDADGTTSAPVSAALPQQAREATKAVVHVVAVGNQHYQDPKIATLQAPANDAKMFDKMVSQSPIYSVRDIAAPIIDSPHLKADLIGKLRALAGTSKPEDTVMLLISGHGLRAADGELYLASTTTRASNLAETALPWREIANALSDIPGRKIVFLDVCHAGAADATSNDLVSSALLRSNDGIVILSASKGRQLSRETAEAGLFTRAVMRAVTSRRKQTDLDGDGVIELNELYRAIKLDVIQSSDGKQVPWVARNALVGPTPVL